ncbi:hypothetical protein CASFOL_000139 [Castilleja foliolosa]|uniref:RNase H type-1 domain-containing protein n=1 Tax=Castilleja foliolosa TaxID=1961234 RepID=A0ABD3EN30_9LAMI
MKQREEFVLFNLLLFDNVWRYRNSLAHGACPISVQDITKSIARQAAKHWMSNTQTAQIGSSANLSWIPPPIGWYKINVDAAFVKDISHSGLVLKDHNGSVSFAFVDHHPCFDAITAECLAILDACLLLHQFKASSIIIESDCLNAVALINGASNNDFWTASPVVDKIKKLWNCWPSWVFKFTPRKLNCAAHNLAGWASCNSFVGSLPLDSIPVVVFCDLGHPLVKNNASFIY